MSETTNEGARARSGERVPDAGPARSWYEVLDVGRDASAEEIKIAYSRALDLIEGRSVGGYLMLDPDAMAAARHDVETAFLILRDPLARARFDAELDEWAEPATEAAPPAPVEPPAPVSRRRAAAGGGLRGAPAKASGAPTKARTAGESCLDAPPEKGEGTQVPAATASRDPRLLRRRLALRILAPVEGLGEPAPAAYPLADRSEARRLLTDEARGARFARVVSHPDGYGNSQAPIDGEINGQVLRRIREARGISIAELSEATKISKTYLRAIEEQNLEDLPARVYLRGFLTQVARVLKVDRTRLAEGYLNFVERYRRK